MTETTSRRQPAADLLTAWIALWNGDYRQAERAISPDFRVHAALLDGSDGGALRGPEGLTGWIRQLRAPLPDLTFTVEVGPMVDGDLMGLRWVARASYAGGFPGAAAPPGTPVHFTGTDLLRVGDGQLVEYWVSSDTHLLLAQLQVPWGR